MFIRLVLFLNFFLVASVAHADPISAIGLVVSGVQALASGASVLGLIVRAALGLGLSLLQQTLNRQKNKQSSVGSVLEIKMGDDQPMTFPVGSRAVGGRRKYIGSWGSAGGTPNAYLTDVIEISNLPSYAGPLGISSLWVGQQKCGVLWDRPDPDGRGYPVQQFMKPNGTVYMWIKYYDGTQTQADPFLVSKFGSHPDRPYGADRIGRGCQYVIVTTRLDNDLQLGGSPPEILVEPHPTPMYDPRKDSTNGGSGSHRFGDWTTYGPTLNPMVIAYNIVRGVYYTADEWVFGGQNVAASRLPNSAWFAAMNECDRDGQYRCGLEVQCDQEPLDVIEDLRVACAGRLAEVGGMIKPLVGAPGAAIYAFDDTGIIITDEQDFEPFPSLTSTHNSIAGTYPEPEQRWTVTDAPEARNLDQEAQDGQRSLPAPVRFDAVPFSDQVQHLMKTMAAEQRRFRIHTLTLPPSAYALEPNDVTSWTSARNVYGNKKFIVTAITGLAGMLQRVTLLEIDPTDYDPPTVYVPAPNGWIGPITAPSQPMTGWTVEPSTIKDAGGIDRRPAIKISCAQDLEDVAGVWVQVRVKATGDVVFDSDSNQYASPYSWIISGNWMISNTDYEARGRYLPKSNRATDWSAWLTVKTPNVLIQASDVLDGAIIASKIADAAVTAAKIMDEAVSNLKLADQAVSTAKLQVAAVTADVLASGAVISTKLADGAVTAAKLAQGAVDATSLASSIRAVEVVSDLPTSGNVEGRQVFLTTDGKLYRYHSGAWTAAVPSTDITGQLVSSQIANGAIANQQLAALAIDASKIANNAITTTKIADDAISTSKLQANSVVAANIAANAITARNLVLQDWENLVPDNQFQTASAWLSRPANVAVQPITTQAFTSKGSLEFTYASNGGYQLAAQSTSFPVTAGQQYLASIQMVRTSGTKLNVWARIHWTGVDGLTLSPDVWGDIANTGGPNAVGGVQTFSSTVTPPANAFGGLVRIYVQTLSTQTDGNISFGGISILRKASASLIIDGAITADKIATNAVIAGKVAANAVTAGTIAANAVTAGTIAAGAVSAAQIAAGAITTDKLAAGSISSQALAVGNGGNYLSNSDLSAGLTGWGPEWSNSASKFTLSLRTDTYAPIPGAIEIRQISGDQGIEYGVTSYNADGSGQQFAVKPNGWYELSVYYLGHRCNGVQPYLAVLDANGNLISYINWGVFPAAQGIDPQKNLANYQRFWAKVQMPANAARAIVFFRMKGTVAGQNDSFLWLTRMYFGEANPNQTEPSPWSDGGITMIAGGNIVSNAVTADKIAANAVTAGKIAANAVTAGTIAAGAVTATTIAGGTITGDKLAANTIGAGQIAADSITAKQLVLTDFSNIADNGWQTGSIDGWVTENLQAFYNDNSGGDAAGYVLQSLGRNCAVSNYIAVTAGETYAFDVWVYNTDSNLAAIYAIGLSPTGAGIPVQLITTATKNAWVRLQVRYTVPSGMTKLAMDLACLKTAGTGTSCYWSKPVMRRAVSAELIVDGAVTANKISVNSLDAITANLGAVNISSAVIGSLQVGTSNIQGGAVTGVGAGRVAGTQTIGANGTANLVSCVVNVAGDGRVVIDAMTLGQFNQNGGSQNSQPIGCNIFRDGTAIFSQTYYLGVVQTVVSGTGGSNGTTTQTTYTAGLVAVSGLYDAPGPGNHTYILQLYCPSNTIGWNESNITATALKR
ncbi:phage tail protein [Rhizobium sp. 11_C7_N12_5]|uniref:phage tail protein n=1 Tax=Rhizobium sp. 11_C7_N12_5 TaxID=3240770 RepID=UPI003F1F4A17